VQVHKLLTRQLRTATRQEGGGIDHDALLAIVNQTYDEFDRDRRLNDRANKLMEEELKEANARAKREHDAVLGAILGNASDGMIVVGRDGTIEYANAAAEAQFGASSGTLAKREIGALLGETASSIAYGTTPMESVGEIAATALDGRSFPVEFSVTTLDMTGGRRQLWTVRDISDRVRSQREVMESRMRFQDFAEASSDCFWEMDETLSRIEVSSAMETPVEAQLLAVLGPAAANEKPEGLAEEGWRALRHHLMARTRFRLRLDFTVNDGEALHISVSGKPVFGLDGKFQGYRGTGRDVTREVTARVAARRAERRLIEAMDAGPSAVALVDAGLNLAASNSALRTLASASGEKLTSKRPFGAFLASALKSCSPMGGTDPAQFLRALAESREMREVAIGNAWYLLAVRTLSEGGMVLNFSDVTAMKQREGELADAKLAAESANRLKSQFLATMSHELRTPLNAILGFSEVIRDCVFGQSENAWDKYSEYAGSIHTSGRHLLSLISEILDLSKIEAGSYLLDVSKLDLRQVLQGAVTIITPTAMKVGVEVKLSVPPEPVWLAADERAMRQVALNLLANAVKFTPHGGRVSVAMKSGPDFVEFEVTDTGIGIAKEHIEAVFELFRQVDSSIARRHEGTGLGLAITKRLVEMHRGTIALESEVAVGTTARVRLPTAQSNALPGKKTNAAA
jgi:two-component system, sensor histidine kinase and response regulator